MFLGRIRLDFQWKTADFDRWTTSLDLVVPKIWPESGGNKNKTKTVIFLFGRALKWAIGGKTDQGINCLSPYVSFNVIDQFW